MNKRVYLDHAATTPLDPQVLEAMLPYLTRFWGNPSSLYAEAREARKGLDAARRSVAELLGCKPQEVIFTSGGSESDNLAIRGAAYASLRQRRIRPWRSRRGDHIITSAIEHHAVLHTVQQLEKEGFRATYLPVDRYGFIDLAALERAVAAETVLVSIMYANNEVGTVEPIADAARIVKGKNPRAVFHTDAVQAVGTLDINVDRLGVDMLSIAGHKIYGPKGVGALYVRSRAPLQPQQLGGSQERNRRAGTEDVARAVGLARAMELACGEREARTARYRSLRDRLLAEVPVRVPYTQITGPADPMRRLAINFSCCFQFVEGEAVLMALDLQGIAASSGSACTSGSLEPSHVLVAMGISEELARGSLRLTVGKDNTLEEIEHVLAVLPGIVAKLRALSPLWRAGAEAAASPGNPPAGN
ncbi:MAG: cysteine desulfurase family protein [Chloroflexota bacterium]|nr:cysteine desulfurase family protein [Chloroflexota bacterium]